MQRWMLVACAAMSWVLGSELLIDIWQAHALLLPFLLYLVLMIGLACGQARWIPFAAGVASVLVQTHISYVFVLDRRRPSPPSPSSLRPELATERPGRGGGRCARGWRHGPPS